MGSFISAKAQYSYTAVFMDVGEEKTINLPSSVTNKDIKESYWSNDSPSYVKITKQSDYSVTIKILKYTSMTCLVEYDYYWGSSREHGNFSIRIDIKKPQSLVLSASPSGGTIEAGTVVTLKATVNGNQVSGADIYYTTNGYPPSTNSKKYSSAGITIDESCTLKAIAYKDEYSDSEVLTEYYTVKENTIAPTDISLPDSKTIKVGESFKIPYTLTPSDATTTLTWTSDDESTVTVSSTGWIKGVKEGESIVRVKTANGKSGSCKVTVVSQILVTSITLNMTSISLYKNTIETLLATVNPNNATDKSVTWTSSNTDVAITKETNNGLMIIAKGVSPGTSIITCKANDGSGVQATCTVTVNDWGISINSTNFPDEIFRNYLLQQDYGQDGKLTSNEISTITEINVQQKEICSLKGIEYFTALTHLYCRGNQLEFLDVSRNTALVLLDCEGNKLTSLDLKYNTALSSLWCNGNKIQSLDLSKNTALRMVDCHMNYNLTSLIVPNTDNLFGIVCYMNSIQGVDMDALINSLPPNQTNDLHYLRLLMPGNMEHNICSKEQVKKIKNKGWTPQYSNSGWQEYEGNEDVVGISIDITNFPDVNFRNYLLEQDYGKDGILTESEISIIKSIRVPDKGISSLKGIEFFTALTSLRCWCNNLTALDVSKNTALTELWCDANPLTALDVSKNTALTALQCNNNQLTALDVSKNTTLTGLSCDDNQLSALDVSKNTKLTSLSCKDNLLSALDVSKNTALTWLICSDNQLTSLDVSKNTELEYFLCSDNLLTALDISKNRALYYLDCSENQLTSIDVSKNTALTYLWCYKNNITGKGMDALINSLPNSNSSEEHYFHAIYETASETNVCTKAQVAAVKAKGWVPQYYDLGWKVYEGSDDAISTGNGTLLDPFNAVAANKIGYALDIGEISSDSYYVQGKISAITYIFKSQYGTAMFYISDDGTENNQFYVYASYYLENKPWTDNNPQIAIGDDVIVYGKITNYEGTPEMANKQNFIYSHNGNTTGINIVVKDGMVDTPVISLSGQRLKAPRKGINIVGGKKVVIK